MIQFPKSTAIGRILPKEAFYKRLTLSNELKERFVSDVRRITLENSLTSNSLHMEAKAEIDEILVLAIDLKKQEFDYRLIENIARQNPHKIIFILRFENQGQLALYYRKLYRTNWEPISALSLEANGFSLDEIWAQFIEQIALLKNSESTYAAGDIDELLKKQDIIAKLKKEIDKIEKLARVEKQPKKKFELAMNVQQLKKQLIELESIGGKVNG